ncbi:MAG: endonuclease/exonuclease/phosphatase family protein [Planctomycetes bacterium]|nr:endonuclease/exonuclease/phosphatase family protein [Planctomycetota bacterium]
MRCSALLLAVLAFGAALRGQEPALQELAPLRVLSLNAWHGGKRVEDGQAKLLAAIRAARADVVGLQEARAGLPFFLAQELGWDLVAKDDQSVAILSRHPVVARHARTKNDAGLGARLRVREEPPAEIEVFVAHLDYDPYGPYQAHFDRAPLEAILEAQRQNQLAEIEDLLLAMRPALAQRDAVPVVLMGDLNTPSHLDWTAACRSRNAGYVIEWPVTHAIERAGFVDVFRSRHPDPLAEPGTTWSPVVRANEGRIEPQDRIDYVFYTGDGARLARAEHLVLGTPQPEPDHAANEWPTDHVAVLAELALELPCSPQRNAERTRLELASSSVRAGEPLVARFSGTAGVARGWIGIWPAPAFPEAVPATRWSYLHGSQVARDERGPAEGNLRFATGADPEQPLPPGEYFAWLLANDRDEALAPPQRFQVLPRRAPSELARPRDRLRVLVWNLWHGGREDGEAGFVRALEILRAADPDVALLVETYGSGQRIAAALDLHLAMPTPADNLALLSRWPFAEVWELGERFHGLGGVIDVPGFGPLALVDVWLSYAAEIWEEGSRARCSPTEMLAQHERSALADLDALLRPLRRRLAERAPLPVLLGGDFNSMSHEDYVESARSQYGEPIAWPATRRLVELGFGDAWRAVHPGVDRAADRTWSPRFPRQEQDRIDFLFWRGERLVPRAARRIDRHPEGFPSDHAALVFELELRR